ncbi:MAG: ABC transporter substrate-binding protein [Deltaproteobacteria bacterium]|nr:ABC transporter substrate-binding protein [Deltaproteobacteria bacterium]
MALAVVLGVGMPAAALAGMSGQEVLIGVYGPYTGFAAQYGISTKIALEIACDDMDNKIGGVPLKIEYGDTASKPAQAVNVMKKFVGNDRMLMVVGPVMSGCAEASFPVANKAGMPALSPNAAVDGLTARNRPWTFRLREGTLIEAEHNAHLFRQNFPDLKTCCIIADHKDRYNKRNGVVLFPKILPKVGVKVLKELAFQSGDLDYSAQVTQIKQLKPDFIMFSAFAQDAAAIVKELRKQGLNCPLFGVSAGVTESAFLDLAGSAANGTFYLSNWAPGRQQDPDNQRKIAEWSKRFPKKGQKPASWHFWWYDAMRIVKKVIEESGVSNKPADIKADRAKIRDALQSLKGYQGTTNTITINKDGEIVPPEDRIQLTIRNGEYYWVLGPNKYKKVVR